MSRVPAELPFDLLIDNSTYFSTKHALGAARPLTAEEVFNIATFTECLVISDVITLAPTSAWHPDESDPLFVPDGPCRQYDLLRVSTAELSRLFTEALNLSRRAVDEPDILSKIPSINASADPIALDRYISEWRIQAQEDPIGFLNIYSGAVYLTDSVTSDFVSGLDTAVSRDDPATRKIAQFLLRTNVAIVLSDSLPYHPHSHRTAYVAGVFGARSSQSPASHLLRVGERTLRSGLGVASHDVYSAPRPAVWMRNDIPAPLVLGAALSASTDPESLIQNVLIIRNLPEAKLYRSTCRRLIETGRSQDRDKQVAAQAELVEASRILTQELRQLSGRLNQLPTLKTHFLGMSGGLQSANRSGLKNYFALILSLYGQTRGSLDMLLARVFRRGLGHGELIHFDKLAAAQLRSIGEYQADVSGRYTTVFSEAHLLDLLVESLNELQVELQGETPTAPYLWDHDKAKNVWRPRGEHDISDFIKRHITKDLESAGVIGFREVRSRSGHGSRSELIDVQVEMSLLSPDGQRQRACVLIEVKGCWNSTWRSAMKSQLRDRYLRDHQCKHGLFIVCWFNCPQWDKADRRRRPSLSFEEVSTVLNRQAVDLSGGEYQLRAVVLNMALRA